MSLLDRFTQMLTGGNLTIAKVEKPATNGIELPFVDWEKYPPISRIQYANKPRPPLPKITLTRECMYEGMLQIYLKQIIIKSFQPAFIERLGKNRMWLPQTPILTGARQETISMAAELFARFIIQHGLECSQMILVPQYFGHKQTRYSLVVTVDKRNLSKYNSINK